MKKIKIPKAIKILTDILRYVKPGDQPEEHDAIKLGVEALKAWKALRDNPGMSFDTLLPGEAEE